MNEGFVVIVLALLGICLGSFVNAAVWRIKVKKDIVHDRSECVHCHHKLAAVDLVPVISWLLLRGRCRYCHQKIEDSPIVELAVMAYFVVSYLVWPIDLVGVSAWIDFSLWLSYGVGLAILFVYDLKWYLLPDRVIWPLVGLSIIDFINRALASGWSLPQSVIEFGLALLPIAGVYYVLHLVSRGRWIGFGDVKLGIFMGLALGWQAALASLLLANLIGCLIVIPGLLTKKLTRDSRIPFGPLLIAGFVIAGLWGTALVDWYTSFFYLGA